ncbi:MAG: peptidase P60 [Alphaproteobacteria bacterium]|nr:peptidase P60 [Alphaproteobacteria bacterium]
MNNAVVTFGVDIVNEARSWVGTPFLHQGRSKATVLDRGGCDCLGLLVGVAEALQLKAINGNALQTFDERDYGHMPNGEKLKAVFSRVLMPIELMSMAPGDVLLMRLEKAPQHVAIVSDYRYGGLGLVHALASARKVVEHRLDEQWLSRIVQVYRVANPT